MRIRCPKCYPEHTRGLYMATAHVTENWILDEDGEFIAKVEGDQEVTHQPDKEDIWTCYYCGNECEVSD
jgi:hypothetical protein